MTNHFSTDTAPASTNGGDPSHVNASASSGTSPTHEQHVVKARTLLALDAFDPAGVTAQIAAGLAGDTPPTDVHRDEAAGIVAEALRIIDGGSEARNPHNTDDGNALRLVAQHGDRIRYVFEHRRWLAWDGKRWAPDATGAVERYAKATVRRMYAEASKLEDDDARKRMVKWAIQSESAGRIDAMLKLARTDERIVAREDSLDSDPWTLNVANGTLDLLTGELGPHDPAAMHSKITTASYDAQAPSGRWDAFLAEVLPDTAVRGYVQKLAGYSLTGEIGENVLPFAYGPGANGKSVFLGVLGDVLGDYASEAPPDLLAHRRERGIPADVANLRGFRFVTTTEVEDGRRMASDLMKRITGERRLKARRLYQDFEGFENVTKLWMAGNDRPQVDGLDEAVWRRIRLIPFEVVIPAARRNPNLHGDLLAERDGILRWMVDGLMAYHRDGLTPPAAVQVATDDYRADSNPLLEWADSECELDSSAWTSTADLRESYERHCRGRVRPIPARSRKWAEGLRSLGCSDERAADRGQARGWAGIALRKRPDGMAF